MISAAQRELDNARLLLELAQDEERRKGLRARDNWRLLRQMAQEKESRTFDEWRERQLEITRAEAEIWKLDAAIKREFLVQLKRGRVDLSFENGAGI